MSKSWQYLDKRKKEKMNNLFSNSTIIREMEIAAKLEDYHTKNLNYKIQNYP